MSYMHCIGFRGICFDLIVGSPVFENDARQVELGSSTHPCQHIAKRLEQPRWHSTRLHAYKCCRVDLFAA